MDKFEFFETLLHILGASMLWVFLVFVFNWVGPVVGFVCFLGGFITGCVGMLLCSYEICREL